MLQHHHRPAHENDGIWRKDVDKLTIALIARSTLLSLYKRRKKEYRAENEAKSQRADFHKPRVEEVRQSGRQSPLKNGPKSAER